MAVRNATVASRTIKALAVSPWRRYVVLSLFSLSAVAVVYKAVDIQLHDKNNLARLIKRQHEKVLPVVPMRGGIYDRNGQPLARSAPVESIWVKPKSLLAAPDYLAIVAKALNQTPEALTKDLKTRTRAFVPLAKFDDASKAQQILKIKAPGIESQRTYLRFYPSGRVAGQLVGYVSPDGKTRYGMESVHDSTLKGSAGTRRYVRARDGRMVQELKSEASTNVPQKAADGQDVTLTIDLRIQYQAYKSLKQAVAVNGAKGGLIVVGDVKTGEILALTALPDFDPNDLNDRASEGVRMRALTDRFEPGSTIKPLLVAVALDAGIITPDTKFDTGAGSFYVANGLTVRDDHPAGVVDVRTLLAKSSNVGSAKIGLQLGAERLWQGYHRFGLGDRIGLNFPGEASGRLRPPKKWGLIGTATASYGYGVGVNAIHLLRAYMALANDGLMPPLSLVKSNNPPAAPVRVISALAAKQVREMLVSVLQAGGTGTRAKVAGFEVAGKTGTIKKTNVGRRGYSENTYQSAFVGMIPADQPRYVAVVMIDEPKSQIAYYGGLVAAPAFAEVMAEVVRLQQLPPDQPAVEPALLGPPIVLNKTAVPHG